MQNAISALARLEINNWSSEVNPAYTSTACNRINLGESVFYTKSPATEASKSQRQVDDSFVSECFP